METTNVSMPFAKAGRITTNAIGVAQVIFAHAFSYGMVYRVACSWLDPGEAVIAYVGNQTENGFTVTTKDTTKGGGGYAPVGNVVVDWIAIPVWD